MLGDSAVLGEGGGGGNSGDAAMVLAAKAASAAGGNPRDGAQAAEAAGADGGVGSNSGGEEDIRRGEEAGERSFGGNRWPRQETLALLKIRSEMDVAFRDASVKGPLWEEVSRKLAELGYHRSAKKCKEKFENVYKYHKRTKEGRTGKSDGKTYRFFDQLEALDQNHPSIHSSAPSRQQRALSPAPVSVAPAPAPPSTVALPPPVVTVPSTTTPPMSMPQSIVTPSLNLTNPSYPSTNPMNLPPLVPNPTSNPPQTNIPPLYPSMSTDFLSNSSSSSTSSDETLEGRRKRERKWKDFFERLMNEVVEKQEDLQKRFLEAIEQRERKRMDREEAWRMQEMARINAEKEILAQERSRAAAKDAAVMSFLQKIAEQQNLGQALNNINTSVPQPQPVQPQQQPAPTQTTIPTPVLVSVQQPATATPPQTQPQPAPPVALLPSVAPPPQQQVAMNMEVTRTNHNGENSNFVASSSSRWPKVEVQALIKLRTDMDAKYQESGPKGPLWEEISAAMRKLGYNRSAKRCKEKWENINKYFKKVKESSKKRPEDSKTCPYFHQLEAIYREKNKHERPEGMMTTPLMVRPEQQWPPQQQARPVQDTTTEKADNEVRERNHEEEDDYEDDDKYGDEDDEDDEGSGKYEIVASKPAPPVSAAQ